MAAFLVADDSHEKILMLRHFLKMAGWTGEVLTAMTCSEAYDVIAKRPDIAYAFVDYYIPSENGPAVITYLKEKCPTCRIALVSSSDNAENAKRARAAGAEVAICTSYQSGDVERTLLDLLHAWMNPA